MVFTILGVVAELERSLIVGQVKVGLRNARANGMRLGRPGKSVDSARVAALRSHRLGWRTVARQLGVGSELCIGSLVSVPKFRERLLERTRVTRLTNAAIYQVTAFDSRLLDFICS